MAFPKFPGDPIKNLALQLGHDNVGSFNIAKVDSGGLQHVAGYVWNPSTLAWELMTQPVISSDVLNVAMTSATESTAIYEDGDSTYICKAPLGSSLGDAVWQIKVLDEGSIPSQILYCDGNADYDNTATNLVTVRGHSYS